MAGKEICPWGFCALMRGEDLRARRLGSQGFLVPPLLYPSQSKPASLCINTILLPRYLPNLLYLFSRVVQPAHTQHISAHSIHMSWVSTRDSVLGLDLEIPQGTLERHIPVENEAPVRSLRWIMVCLALPLEAAGRPGSGNAFRTPSPEQSRGPVLKPWA